MKELSSSSYFLSHFSLLGGNAEYRDIKSYFRSGLSACINPTIIRKRPPVSVIYDEHMIA